ncbi:unnamed protein product [Kluyveromyces dobzhanskii CBS 2104]|uniref:WGS project CCBQ000000000 data, contig 00106 n=1 Tax=Kluyveromyces dobzhanskii CBS 2104 TaxID=1427455 RepID=A0A0A8L602_9SACH|nr:unnamed protein product [Kluyveromyces dobzhanskii CBS 2104]
MARKITWQDVGVRDGFPLISPGFVSESRAPLLFTSGCVGTDPVTDELPEDLEQQARNMMTNLKKVLEVSGSSFDSVLKVLLFVSDGSYAGVVNKVFKEYFPNQPARSCVVVSFPNTKLKVELECIAEVPAKKRWFKL